MYVQFHQNSMIIFKIYANFWYLNKTRILFAKSAIFDTRKVPIIEVLQIAFRHEFRLVILDYITFEEYGVVIRFYKMLLSPCATIQFNFVSHSQPLVYAYIIRDIRINKHSIMWCDWLAVFLPVLKN